MSARPVLIYDGACGFCRRRVGRWRALTGDSVEYTTAEDAAARFPQVVDLDTAVACVDVDGAVYRGAEAVFRAHAWAPGRGWKLWAYRVTS